MQINTPFDLNHYLGNAGTKAAALAYLQSLMDEEYQFGADGTWGTVSNSGLSRLGLTRAEAVTLGATDRTVVKPAVAVDLAAVKTAARSRLDVAAEALRQTVLTPGIGQMATYQTKETQARSLLQDPEPDETKYPDIYNEVGITADTAHEVAMAVLAAAEKWRLFGRSIEKTRLAGKKAITAADTAAAVVVAEAAVTWPTAE
jgi:hypothetical protein